MPDKISPPPSKINIVELLEKKILNKREWMTWFNLLYQAVADLLIERPTHVTIQGANFGKGTSAPTQVIIGDYTGWEYTIGDDSVFNIELGHDVDDSQDIGVHLTYVINEAYVTNSGEVQFQVDYSCVPHIGGGETITSPGSSGTLTTGDINIPATAYETAHVVSMSIPAADYSVGDLVGITISRIAINDGNNPTAHPVILTLHLEYTRKAIDWYTP